MATRNIFFVFKKKKEIENSEFAFYFTGRGE